MALEQITFNLGALDDAANSGKNYVENQVFEVFNIDDTYADIFADSAGTIPIDQSGIQNISNSDGECKFFIDRGFYNIKSDGKTRQLNANFSFEFETVSDAVNARFISLLEGRMVFIVERGAYFNVVLSSSLTGDGEGMDELTSAVNPNYGLKLIIDSNTTVVAFGAYPSEVTSYSDNITRAFELGVFDFPFKKKFKIEKQVVVPQIAVIQANNCEWIIDDTFALPDGYASWTLAENAGKEGVIRFKNGQRQFNPLTASELEVYNLNIKHYRSNENSPPRTLKPTNTNKLKMRGCNWEMDGDGSVKGTNIWVDGANSNVDIQFTNTFKNTMKKVQDGGGCFWVSSIVGYTSDESQFTKNIKFNHNTLIQDNDDDLIALFARQSVIDGVEMIGNKLISSGTEQTVLVSVHSVLDFLPQTRVDSTAYSLGDYIGLAEPNGYFYKCTQAGTSGVGEASFNDPDDGKIITDGTCLFEAIPCGVRNVEIERISIKDGSSKDFTVRIGRDREEDLHAQTRDITVIKPDIEYSKSEAQDSLIRVHQPQAKNVRVVRGRLKNKSSSTVTFAVNGADSVNNVVVEGKYSFPIIAKDSAENNTWLLSSEQQHKPFASANILSNNKTLGYFGGAEYDIEIKSNYSVFDLYFSNNTISYNLLKNSNNLTGTGWTGSGQFTSLTKNYADDVYSRNRAARLVNNTGSNQTLKYTLTATPDGKYTAYIAIKGNSGSSGFVNIALNSVAAPAQTKTIRQYFNGEKYTVVPLSLVKNTAASDDIEFDLTVLDGSDLLVCDAQINNGEAKPYSYTEQDRAMIRGLTIYAPTFPTTGNWYRGDRVINNEPAVGQPKSWVCTVGDGTDAGTWVSEGVL